MPFIFLTGATAFETILAGVDFTQFQEMFMLVAAVGLPAVISIMVAKKGIGYLLSWVNRAK